MCVCGGVGGGIFSFPPLLERERERERESRKRLNRLIALNGGKTQLLYFSPGR